ncbi:MAG: dienelactone hydrolase family protein [Pirellulales bacterium]|nr:dienelactone hydrolase family protein [Pirellulales bacterium]
MWMHRRLRLAALMIPLAATAMSAPDALAAPAAKEPAVDPLEAFEAREFKGEGGLALPYRLLKPLDFEGENRDPQQKYPLLLFLHGAGERGDDNQRQLIHGGRNLADEALRRRHPALVVVPQCPAEQKWVEVPWDGRTHRMPESPGRAMQAVFDLLDSLAAEFPVDKQRIYAVGLSMGGFGTWDILQRRPELLAAAVPICGGGDTHQVEQFKDTPAWVFHGGADPTVMPQRSREMVDALQAVGGHVIYTEYEGVGHDSWTETFNNRLLWDWLFAQSRK